MPRPFNRTQARQNAAFLAALRRTGNARAAARDLGLHRATMTRRRAKDAAFAAEWDAALTLAHAALNATQNPTRSCRAKSRHISSAAEMSTAPTDAEPMVVRRANGRLQLRRPTRRRLDSAAEQMFLSALSACANIRLAAAAAGFSHSAFYQRAKASPGFAREMRLALEMGYDRLELALLESFEPDSSRHDAWRHNEPPPIPSMTPTQALQLLYLHQKKARLQAEPPHIKRRRGESSDARSYRLGAMYEAARQRDREAWLIAEHERRAAGGRWVFGPKELPPLPDLSQVKGWSKADVTKRVHDAERALFGGWRLKDWK